MPIVVHFELPADDPQRAVGFYEKVFGWSQRDLAMNLELTVR
jgi:predicted enzyme related to lactoylglutathione lyase